MSRYSQDFKEKLIEEVKEVKSLKSVALKHDIPSSTLATWLKKDKSRVKSKVLTFCHVPHSSFYYKARAQEIRKMLRNRSRIMGHKSPLPLFN